MGIKFAVQLYSVRNECEKDFIGTLKKVSELGYSGVEFAGFYDTKAEELKQVLKELDLTPVASHVGIDVLKEDIDNIIRYHKAIGCHHLVIPYSPAESLSQLETLISDIKIVLDKLSGHDMTLYYHNHARELTKINDEFLLTMLFQNFNAQLLAEVDTHWVCRAGVDPITYLNELKSYVRLIHIKDMVKLDDGSYDFAAIGHGFMDIKSIVETAENMGIQWAIVENDQPKPDGLTNIEKSITYIKNSIIG